MSETTTESERDGGLPKVDDPLAGFAAAALPPRRERRRERPPEPKPQPEVAGEPAASSADTASTATTVEAPAVSSEATAIPAQPTEPEPAPAAAAEVAVRTAPPNTPVVASPRPLAGVGPRASAAAAERSTQCTINVSAAVRDRFAAFQLAKKLERGAEPTNAVVVRWAVLHAHRNGLYAQMREYVRHRVTPVYDEDDDPDGLFGDVPGRRAERGRTRDTVQQSFRPSLAELDRYDALAAEQGFANRSEFLDAALDAFLPQMPNRQRRR